MRNIFILLILISSPEIFAEDYYASHNIGWHWYAEPVEVHQKNESAVPLNPVSQMQQLRDKMTQALDAAILEPTPSHIKTYLLWQNALSDRASLFAKNWQALLVSEPLLNYAIAHPVNQVGREVVADLNFQEEEKAIQQLFKTQGMFFFYRSSCPYCRRFSPIVKNFTERYHIALIPITTDGIALPEFPHSKQDSGQAAFFHVQVEPALFMVNPNTHQAIPVVYGLVTESELRARILEIAKKLKGENA